MKTTALIISILCCFLVKSQTVVEYNMKMWTSFAATMWDDTVITTWGFSEGSNYPPLPGPTLYANEGDTIIVNIRNQSQPFHHTIHWHGLDVDQANDGVPQLSFDLAHMDDSTYTFVASHAGTYLYHCHVASIVHVQMGMYGNVIIHAANGENQAYTGGPSYTKEYNWLMSEIDKEWHDSVPLHHDKPKDSVYMEFHVPPYVPEYFLINGKSKQQLLNDNNTAIHCGADETIFLRLSNVGYFMNNIVFPSGVKAEIIMSDGRALPQSEYNDSIVLTSGERYGVLLSFDGPISDSIAVSYIDANSFGSATAIEYVPVNAVINPSVRELPEYNIQVLNGAKGNYFIQGLTEPTPLKVFDINGKLITSKNINNLDNVNLSSFPNGFYFFQFETKQYFKTIKVHKL